MRKCLTKFSRILNAERLPEALFMVSRLDSKGAKVGIRIENTVGKKIGPVKPTTKNNENMKRVSRHSQKQVMIYLVLQRKGSAEGEKKTIK